MTRAARRLLLPALLGVLLASGAAPARGADAPKAAWEAEVEHETAEQTGQIDRARQRKAMAGVVNAYASRLSRSRSPLNHYLYGRALYYNGDPVAARAQMQLALDADPGFYPARLRMALLLLELKNHAEAERQLAQVLASRPDHPEALELMTRSAVDQKDWVRAVAFLSRRLDRDPSDARTRALLAQVHVQRLDWDGALREWNVLLQHDPSSPAYRYWRAVCRAQKGELEAAAAELETLAKEEPGRLEVLDRLRGIYAKRKDWDRVRATFERMAPYLPEDQRKEVLEIAARLRQGPPEPGEGSPSRLSWSDVAATAATAPERDRRERALRALYEGCQMGLVKEVPSGVLRHVMIEAEPDAACRGWVVRILGELDPMVLPLVSVALYDEDATVRMIASEVLGGMGHPAAILYLLPFTETQGLDVVEYESVRAALVRLTGAPDLPPGTTAVTSPEDVAASREAWRRWRLSEQSTPLKLAGIRQLEAVRETAPERFLYDSVQDPTFEVMRAAYLAMRRAVARPPSDPVERKVFPRFPSVPDQEVTRAGMRALQDRVRAWWDDWVAERRAYQRARGSGGR